ncbi:MULTISPECIES: CbiX/SirB N-terminal domain-containing protein [unclassified Ruegeria]|uniref:CbiX/SirB N-terminal domain-containing protein n=1 Tax=unclassified Ruegeria TaxID=2625375 RepID=UPI00148A0670|nr:MULTISPECIES: CbiX/SirB N-terminal domain-containing protein [unclassified Ruegeria]
MPHAVIVAHGQPSDPDPAETALARFAAKVHAICPDMQVHSATLAAPLALERCLDSLPADTVIYPLFMAKGWFVTSALPKRVAGRSVRILDPLGVDPKLPMLVAEALRTELQNKDWQAEQTNLVVAAHGSGRSLNPSQVTLAFASELAALVPFADIRTGFVEEAPSIAEAASDVGSQSVCLPFFACTGGHVLEDVPEELGKAGFSGLVMPVVGELPVIQRHIADQLGKALVA